MAGTVENLEFQAEARQLLRLMVHSVYSDKDIFLRELISNSSDALDKLRLAALVDKDLDADISDLRIEIEADQEARTLTVRDNGIGMSRAEVIELIGTIAKSGTAELLRTLRESAESSSAQLIGQFGVGFYATFMVADRVSLVTRRAGQAEGTRWESEGEGSYTIETLDSAAQGTTVTLHLKPADTEDHLSDYTSDARLREIVKRYSDFIAWPIRMDGAVLNSMKAIWARPREEVTDEEYREFYKHLSHDWMDPLETIHMRAEGTFEYEALLFIPSMAPWDLHQRDARSGVQLYVKRVFIMDHCDELMPAYLRLVRGVVDAADLSLNISREILQRDRHMQLMRKRLVRRVLSTVKEMMTAAPEKYQTFWREFGRAVKEGLLSDVDNQAAILEIISAGSTNDPAKPTTLTEYVSRMKEGQEEIYYLTGDSRPAIEQSPHLEAFRAKGYEVLLLTDPVDEMWVGAVPEFTGKRFQSIAKGQLNLETEEERKAAEPEREQQEKDFAPLLAWLGETLSEKVSQVRLSPRLTTSAACLVGEAHDPSPSLERMYRMMGQQLPPVRRVLELNPTHPLVLALQQAHESKPADEPALPETAELLYGLAVLAEGGELETPARFTQLLADRLARTI